MMDQKLIEKCAKTYASLKSQRATADKLGVSRSTVRRALQFAKDGVFTSQSPKRPVVIKAAKRKTRRFIFTSAQDNTEVHQGFLTNLQAYADFHSCPIYIGGFTYNKRLFEDHSKANAFYHPSINGMMVRDQIDIGDNLIFCGNMNTLPTAVSPLSGFETYTRSKWGIFPHAKVQLSSIPTMKHALTKQIMTTGAITLPNYVQKRAGIRAHFHHVIGAVIVEIDPAGNQFCRHLIAEDDGSFQDLMYYVTNGVITDDHTVEAINWGDIHFENMDPQVAKTCFNIDLDPNVKSFGECMLDILEPKYQFFHDITDFTARNHHNINDPYHLFKTFAKGESSVSAMFHDIGTFLEMTWRDFCTSVVVESNHDKAALRWLKEADWKKDPVNAQFYLAANLAALNAIENYEDFSVLEWAVRGMVDPDAVFLREDDSFTICDGEIECGIHGHLGANGAKGTPKQFTKTGPKANTGHTHSPSIIDGIYTAGTSSKLDMGYNKGLSSWAHSHIVTYRNGKRAIVTLQDGQFCAM